MSDSRKSPPLVSADAISPWQRIVRWLEDPMGQVVAATGATIGSFGVVLSGIWLVNLAVN